MNRRDDDVRAEQYLRMIERTRLLRNTTAEMEELVDFSIGKGNGLARMGGRSPFIKDAIVRELAHIAKEETELDLQEVLDTYQEADHLLGRMGKVKDAESLCQQLIWHFFADEELADSLAPIAEKMESRHVPLLVLMLCKALPRLSAKGGDVRDIGSDYRRVFALLSETVNRNILLKRLPALTQMEDEVRQKPEHMSRLHLISQTNTVLNAYGLLSTRERISLSNQELAQNQFEPDVEGVWTEDNSVTECWRFEVIANGFHLYHYSLCSEQREWCYTKYFMKFYRTADDVMALVIHPHAIHYMLAGQPLPNHLFAYLDCTIEDGQITFEPRTTEGLWFRLRRISRGESSQRLSKLLENDLYAQTDSHPEDAYDFTLSLAAITNDHIYIKKDERQYYKIAKSLHPLLADVRFADNIGVITFAKVASSGNEMSAKTYVAFDDINLYYDVSTPMAMEQADIQIADTIRED